MYNSLKGFLLLSCVVSLCLLAGCKKESPMDPGTPAGVSQADIQKAFAVYGLSLLSCTIDNGSVTTNADMYHLRMRNGESTLLLDNVLLFSNSVPKSALQRMTYAGYTNNGTIVNGLTTVSVSYTGDLMHSTQTYAGTLVFSGDVALTMEQHFSASLNNPTTAYSGYMLINQVRYDFNQDGTIRF